MEKVNHTLDKRNLQRLKQQVEKTGISRSEIIRRALDKYFQAHEDRIPKSE